MVQDILVGYFTILLVFTLHSIKQQDLEHFEGTILGPIKVLAMCRVQQASFLFHIAVQFKKGS
jgi:hypothetical protein